ncbi:MAG: response regulator, partial [Planctomycetota bacterium]|nr:response regulator [Planctomycetota bacterium]
MSFDIVLMDIEMPGMDGFETTRAIRKKEDGTGHRVPIIAITAHAVKGFRERCFEAGMDDYLAKPLKREQLFESMNALDDASRGLPVQEPITLQEAEEIAEEIEIPPTAEVNPVSILP